jgi:transcriptional regulator of arginine metabolism
MVEKRRRQSALVRLVRRHAASTQLELVSMLRKAGFLANQASVSRDMRELSIVKVNGRYQPVAPRGAARGPSPGDALHELITEVEPIGANLIVVRTKTGAASAVAVEIDRQRSAGVAGTIAGDDTILVAVKSRSAQGQAVVWLQQLSSAP